MNRKIVKKHLQKTKTKQTQADKNWAMFCEIVAARKLKEQHEDNRTTDR
jgi:hypothetical protein